jgi:hypothetical protein
MKLLLTKPSSVVSVKTPVSCPFSDPMSVSQSVNKEFKRKGTAEPISIRKNIVFLFFRMKQCRILSFQSETGFALSVKK